MFFSLPVRPSDDIIFHTAIFQPMVTELHAAGDHLVEYRGMKHPSRTIGQLFNKIVNGNQFSAENVTVFLDGITDNVRVKHSALKWLHRMLDSVANAKKLPKIEVIFYDIDSYLWYLRKASKTPKLHRQWINFMDTVSVIYFRVIPQMTPKNKIKLRGILQRNKLGWYWIPERQEISIEYLQNVYRTLTYTKRCKLIVAKEPLGQEQSASYLAWFMQLFLNIEDFLKKKNTLLLDRMSIDPCITTCAAQQKEDHKCSANVNMVHIWPNGHVTGCPYKCAMSRTGISRTIQIKQALLNLKCLRNRYDYDLCSMNRAYQTVRKKP